MIGDLGSLANGRRRRTKHVRTKFGRKQGSMTEEIRLYWCVCSVGQGDSSVVDRISYTITLYSAHPTEGVRWPAPNSPDPKFRDRGNGVCP